MKGLILRSSSAYNLENIGPVRTFACPYAARAHAKRVCEVVTMEKPFNRSKNGSLVVENDYLKVRSVPKKWVPNEQNDQFPK